jgi:hypothetical protein
MRRILGVGVVLLLMSLLTPSAGYGQQSGGDGARSRLGANYPNPFNPETRIPFILMERDFPAGRPAVVTMHVRTMLGEIIAIPHALEHPDGSRPQLLNLHYTTPGQKVAHWDGLNLRGQKAASGPYILELVVNGERSLRTIVVAK